MARPYAASPFQWREREARADLQSRHRYLRRLLFLGAMAQISARRGRREVPSGKAPEWLDLMLARKPVKVVAIALANRLARTIWALIRRGDSYRTAAA